MSGFDMEEYRQVNKTLVKLFQEILRLEEKAIITEEFRDLTNNDMHVIEAIGLGEGRNMSSIAKSLRITVGSLTISINALVKKGYVERNRSEEDRRVVMVRLTQKGEKAYHHHENYHANMTRAVLADLDPTERADIMKLLVSLENFFEGYSAQEQN